MLDIIIVGAKTHGVEVPLDTEVSSLLYSQFNPSRERLCEEIIEFHA